MNVFFCATNCDDPLPDDSIVIVSVLALVVKVILLPAAKVNVSVAPSATTLDCPATAIVLKASVTLPVAVDAIVMVSPVSDILILLPAAIVTSSVHESLPVNLIIALLPLVTLFIVYVVFALAAVAVPNLT